MVSYTGVQVEPRPRNFTVTDPYRSITVKLLGVQPGQPALILFRALVNRSTVFRSNNLE